MPGVANLTVSGVSGSKRVSIDASRAQGWALKGSAGALRSPI